MLGGQFEAINLTRLTAMPDGGMLAAGSGDNGAGPTAVMFRYRRDGLPDTSFGDAGVVALPGVDEIKALAATADGGVVAVARVSMVAGSGLPFSD